MATPRAAQTSVKVYRPSFLDTTGDLRPSVERELVTISNAFQKQQEFLDNHLPGNGGGLELRALTQTTPFIDFHYDYKNAQALDFNVRIVNNEDKILRFLTYDQNVNDGYATLGVGPLSVHGDINATGDIHGRNFPTSSDRNLKDNIKPIENSLDKIDNLVGSTWDWKDGYGSDAGLIAQDVQSVLPEAINDSNPEYLRLNYSGVIGLLVNAVKELKEEVRLLKEEK